MAIPYEILHEGGQGRVREKNKMHVGGRQFFFHLPLEDLKWNSPYNLVFIIKGTQKITCAMACKTGDKPMISEAVITTMTMQ